MASKVTILHLCLAVMVMAGLYAEAVAQTGCTTALISLLPCLNFATGNSTTPSLSCCSQLASVVQSQPMCLCSLINGGDSTFGITINETLALALPGACNVQTPPVNQCNNANGPATSPAASPADLPANSPSTAVPAPLNTAASPIVSPPVAISGSPNTSASPVDLPANSPLGTTPGNPNTSASPVDLPANSPLDATPGNPITAPSPLELPKNSPSAVVSGTSNTPTNNIPTAAGGSRTITTADGVEASEGTVTRTTLNLGFLLIICCVSLLASF